jgi:sugar phosphate isomerase/epimerase
VRPAVPGHPGIVGTLFEDTVHRRRYCGEGSFDLTGIITALRTAGWTGPGVEILSDEHRSLPVDEALSRAAATARRQLEAASGAAA